MDRTTADAKPANLGASLRVPSVQHLAARDPRELTAPVLQRYVRPRGATDGVIIAGEDDGGDVPLVDLGRLLDPGSGEAEAAKLKFACEEWGFFQVVNHGIPEEVVEAMKRDMEEFFRLPLPAKEAVAQVAGGIEGYGQAFVVSEEQKLDWGDMYFLATQPPEYRIPSLWTTQPSSFRTSMECYSMEVQRVAARLVHSMAKNLGLEDAEKLTAMVGSQTARMNYYPPCTTAHDRVLGLSPHSDAVGLTLLLQLTLVTGLHIRRKGRWLPVQPLPGALVANVGDIIEVATNGKYKSIEHRAVVNAHSERMSIAAFHSPKFGTTFGPLEEIVQEDEVHYRTISFEDYVKLVLSSKLDGKNIMEAMKINP